MNHTGTRTSWRQPEESEEAGEHGTKIVKKKNNVNMVNRTMKMRMIPDKNKVSARCLTVDVVSVSASELSTDERMQSSFYIVAKNY